MNPIPARERIQAIDILRGMALFGILASNMRAFNGPLAAYMDHSLMWQGVPDRMAQGLIDVFISQKFITIFSFLFGIGFAVMMDRAKEKGLTGRGFYFRRLGVLLAMGLVHWWLIWYGDILTAYALMGFALFLFRASSSRKILIWALALYFWPLFMNGLMVTAGLLGLPTGTPPATTPEQLQAAIRTYSTGTFVHIFLERARENAFMCFGFLFFYPRFLGVFLFGLLVWRKGIVSGLAAHAGLLRRCRNIGLAVGLPLNLVAVILTEIYHPNPMGPEPLMFGINCAMAIGVPALSLSYLSSVGLLCLDRGWLRKLSPFGAVGRTALTNYLFQSAVCTTLYYSWGFGLYGQVGPLIGLAITIVIFALQTAVSDWWMKRFSFGPLEWLWRSLTYSERQPMRLCVAHPAAQ